MNLTIHHFKKEVRYLFPRWLPWLAVLAVSLALDAEWIAPLRLNTAEPAWVPLMPILVWAGAVWLAMSYPPEDALADDHSFIAVKPLPQRCFWASRCLVFVLLIILPLVLHEGIYLWVSNRPAEDIALGVFERAFVSGAVLGWLLPMPLLAGGWRRYWLLGITVFSALLLQFAVQKTLFQGFRLQLMMFVTNNKTEQAAYVCAALVIALAWWQNRCGWSFQRNVACVVAIAALGLGLSASPWLQSWSEHPRDASWVAGMEQKYGTSLTPESISASTYEDAKKIKKVDVSANVPIPEVPANIRPRWRYKEADMRQGSLRSNGKSEFYGGFAFPFVTAMATESDAYVAAAFEPSVGPNTLAVCDNHNANGQDVSVARIARPANIGTPVDITSRQEVDWVRYSVLGSVPLVPGATVHSRFADVEVLSTSAEKDGQGKPVPGSVSITIKLSYRTLESGGTPYPMWGAIPLMIYAPNKRLLWQRWLWEGLDASRANHSGWQRLVIRGGFKNVIVPGTGITAANLKDLRLLVARQEFLGTSHHTLTIHDFDLSKHAESDGHWPYVSSPLVTNHPREALLNAIEKLPKPSADAPRAEVAHYLANAFLLAQSLNWRQDKDDDHQPQWPGDDRAAAELLAPYVLRYPDILTELKSLNKLGGGDLFRQVIQSTLLLANLPHISRSSNNSGLAYHEQKPGKNPSEIDIRMSDDFLAYIDMDSRGWDLVGPEVSKALRTKSSEPLWALQEQVNAIFNTPQSDQENLKSLRKVPMAGIWWNLKTSPSVQAEARAIIREKYFANVPPYHRLEKGNPTSITLAAVAAGIPEALDCMLRQTSLLSDRDLGRHGPSDLSMLSEALGRKKLEFKDLPDFIREVRGWRAEDFIYDDKALTWKLRTQP